MTIQLIRQQDTPSLIRNGTFGAGLAFWIPGPNTVHAELSSATIVTASLINSPRYMARVPTGESIQQIIGRSDIFTYPSRRYVENLEAWPIGINTYNIRFSANTRLDGVPLASGEDPFSFDDAEGQVTIQPGTQLEVEDQYRQAYSGPYRIGRSYEETDSLGGAFVTVQASPINGTIPHLAESTDFSGATYTYDEAANSAVIEVSGIYEYDRQLDQDILGLTGFQPNDFFIITGPDFRVARVIGVTREVDRYQVEVVAVPNAPFLEATNAEDNPFVITTVALTEWFISTRTTLNMVRELPVFQYDFTLAYSCFPGSHDGLPSLDIVDRAGNTVAPIPLFILENGSFAEILSVSKNPDLATIFRRRLHRFHAEFRKPPTGLLRVTINSGAVQVDIGDVVLFPGNYTRHHDYSDLDDATVSIVSDRRAALDRLLHGVDEGAGLLPRGTVILYTGGAICPPGFKRVESLPESRVDGLEALPAPDTAVYDADRNRTIMEWNNQSFDLLDSNGNTIPIEGDTQDITVVLPSQAPFNSAFETVVLGPVHQRIQPGMSLRIKVSDIDTPSNRLFDYSVLVRQAFVERTEAPGVDSNTGITYPVFMSSADFAPEEITFTPVGPPSSQQPINYSAALPTTGGGIPLSPKGTKANPASFSGLQAGAATMVITGVQLTPLAVGETIYIRWTSTSTIFGGTTTSGGFLGKIVANAGSNITVARLDGRGMIVTGATTPISGTAYFSDGLVFGSDSVVTRTVIGQAVVWSARRFTSSFRLTVFGDVAADVIAFNSELVVEPSGFIRYGSEPLDYGSMGHSHEITRGDAPFNENIAPHVSLNDENISPTWVARKHGHGYMPKYLFPIPRFIAFLLCEKL